VTDLLGGTRVALVLPVNNRHERRAAAAAIAEVESRFGGVTHSVLRPAGYRGYWVDPETGQRFVDQVAMVITDVESTPDDPDFVAGVGQLKADVLDAYNRVGSPQLEVWLLIHGISRVE
jgi:hypothetical protein